jgi:Cu-processing system permease protein
VYRLINLAGFDTGTASVGVMALGSDLDVPAPVLWACLLAWVGIPLALAYGLFKRRAA